MATDGKDSVKYIFMFPFSSSHPLSSSISGAPDASASASEFADLYTLKLFFSPSEFSKTLLFLYVIPSGIFIFGLAINIANIPLS